MFRGFARCQYGEVFLHMDCEGNELPAEEHAVKEAPYPSYSHTYDLNLTQGKGTYGPKAKLGHPASVF